MRLTSLTLAAMLLASPAALAQSTAPETRTTAVTADGQFYSHQAGEMRASKLIGTNVTNAANESVGEIKDVVLGKDGASAQNDVSIPFAGVDHSPTAGCSPISPHEACLWS